MPSIRIGFSTDFSLTSEQVGIGTTLPSARLDVAGQILSDNSSGSGGLSTITRYDGFLGSEQRLSYNVSIGQTSKGNLNSLSGEIILDNEITVTDGTPLTGGRLDSLTVTGAFDLPHGGTASRQTTPEKGSTRFNQDLGQLEFYTGTEWRTTLSYDGSGRGRGVFSDGNGTKTLKYINIATRGNSENFGELSSGFIAGVSASYSSSTRGIFAGGGGNPAASNVMEYITIASQGNGLDFGDLTQARRSMSGASSSTRGLNLGGYVTPLGTVNIIDYVEISTIGNAVDFGDLNAASSTHGDTAASPTRAITMGGTDASFNYERDVDYITIASKGNSIKFGEWIFAGGYGSGGQSNSIRAIKAGGFSFATGGANSCNLIGAITIATGGSAIAFGDLGKTGQDNGTYFAGQGGAASATRGIFYNGGQSTTPTARAITSIELSTGGQPTYFGDAGSPNMRFHAGLSDSHGGLGGF